jgi:hypothetical protein
MTTTCLSPRTLARDFPIPSNIATTGAPRTKALGLPPTVAVRRKPAQPLSLRLPAWSGGAAVPPCECQRAPNAGALFSPAGEVSPCR